MQCLEKEKVRLINERKLGIISIKRAGARGWLRKKKDKISKYYKSGYFCIYIH